MTIPVARASVFLQILSGSLGAGLGVPCALGMCQGKRGSLLADPGSDEDLWFLFATPSKFRTFQKAGNFPTEALPSCPFFPPLLHFWQLHVPALALQLRQHLNEPSDEAAKAVVPDRSLTITAQGGMVKWYGPMAMFFLGEAFCDTLDSPMPSGPACWEQGDFLGWPDNL